MKTLIPVSLVVSMNSEPSDPKTSRRTSRPPLAVQLFSHWPSAPPGYRRSTRLLSSSVVLWPRVAVQPLVASGFVPNRCRVTSIEWQPMSRRTPPPARSGSQNHRLWGPEWASLDRTQVTFPSTPPRMNDFARAIWGMNIWFSA